MKLPLDPRRLAAKLFPILRWSKTYTTETGVGDLIAGITVALTLIPQSIAYASLAGFEPQYGLYASLLGGFVYALMGTCPQINIGPTALLSLLTLTYTSGMNSDFAILLCFMAGIVQLIAGISQLGFLVEFVSLPVVSGFTSAAALTIASSQIKGLLGLRFSAETFITTWQGVYQHIKETRYPDTLLSLACCIVLMGMKVNENDIICQSCFNHANSQAADENRPEEATLGHRRVCTLCGCSLLRRRYHPSRFRSVQDSRVIKVIKEWILPCMIGVSSFLCHSCWVRASKASCHFYSAPSTSSASRMPVNEPSAQGSPETQESPSVEEHLVPSIQDQPASTQMSHVNTIVLPDYFRAVETESRCFVEGCHRSERNRVTLSMRKQLVKMYNYYVPPNNRSCDIHLTLPSLDFLNDITNNIINSFTTNHIQDMLR